MGAHTRGATKGSVGIGLLQGCMGGGHAEHVITHIIQDTLTYTKLPRIIQSPQIVYKAPKPYTKLPNIIQRPTHYTRHPHIIVSVGGGGGWGGDSRLFNSNPM